MSHALSFHPQALAGRSALVTGAARGLGYEIAAGLAQAGAQVWLGGRNTIALDDARSQLQALFPQARVHSLPFDVTDLAALSAALDRIAAEDGKLDILVNNVGERDRRPLDAFTAEDVRRLFDANVLSAFELSRRGARLMPPSGGRIVNITSIAGPISRAGDAVYTATKGALDALTRALAAELGPRRVTVNAVAPGYFATQANAAMTADPAVAAWLEQRTSLGRWGEPREIAGAVVFLASDAASYITGSTLAVDGGYLAHF